MKPMTASFCSNKRRKIATQNNVDCFTQEIILDWDNNVIQALANWRSFQLDLTPFRQIDRHFSMIDAQANK